MGSKKIKVNNHTKNNNKKLNKKSSQKSKLIVVAIAIAVASIGIIGFMTTSASENGSLLYDIDSNTYAEIADLLYEHFIASKMRKTVEILLPI